jgi:hypothetical protein
MGLVEMAPAKIGIAHRDHVVALEPLTSTSPG